MLVLSLSLPDDLEQVRPCLWVLSGEQLTARLCLAHSGAAFQRKLYVASLEL